MRTAYLKQLVGGCREAQLEWELRRRRLLRHLLAVGRLRARLRTLSLGRGVRVGLGWRRRGLALINDLERDERCTWK